MLTFTFSVNSSLSQQTSVTFSGGSEKSLAFLDTILFQHKYEPTPITDSVTQVLFGSTENTNKVLPFKHYFLAELQAAKSHYRIARIHIDTALYTTTNPTILAQLFLKKGNYNAILNNLDNAYTNFRQALDIAKASHDTLLIAKTYTAFGEFYRKSEQFDLGFQSLDSAFYFLDHLSIGQQIRVNALDRYAAIYNQIGRPDLAINFSHKALNLAEEIKAVHSQAVSHNELGYCYEHLQQPDSAEYHYLQAIGLWTSIDAQRYLSNAKFNLSRLYLIQKKYYPAKELLFNIEENTINKGWYELYPMMYEKIALIYGAEGDSLAYFHYLIKSKEANNRMNHENNKKEMYQLSFEYEQNANLRLIKNQQSEINLKESNLNLKDKQTTQLRWFLVIAFLLLATTLLLLRRTRSNEKSISKINDTLIKTVKEKEALLREVHHRVKNNFQMVHSLMTLRSLDLNHDAAVEVFDEMQSRIHSMALVHEQLYSGSSLDKVDLKLFLQDIVGSLAHSDLTSQDFLTLNGEEVKVHIDQAIPLGMIIHELATNSIKYAWTNHLEKKISLIVSQENNHLSIIYADNGQGLPSDFNIASSKSFGLKLVNLFVNKQLKGKIVVLEANEGAKFKIDVTIR